MKIIYNGLMWGRIWAEVVVQFRTSLSLNSDIIPLHAMGAEVWLHSS